MTPDNTMADTLAVVRALKKHLKEPHCRHSIRSIVSEGLGNKKAAGVASQTPAQAETTFRTSENGNYTSN